MQTEIHANEHRIISLNFSVFIVSSLLCSTLFLGCREEIGQCSRDGQTLCIAFDLKDRTKIPDTLHVSLSAPGSYQKSYDYDVFSKIKDRPFFVEYEISDQAIDDINIDAVASRVDSYSYEPMLLARAQKSILKSTAARPIVINLDPIPITTDGGSMDLGVSLDMVVSPDMASQPDISIPHWEKTYESAGYPLQAITGFVSGSSLTIWAVGKNSMIVKGDGRKFTGARVSTTAYEFNGVWPESIGTAWVVGNGGIVLRDTGTGWVDMASGTTQDLYAISSGQSIVTVGSDKTNGRVWGGIQWTDARHSSGFRMNGLWTKRNYYFSVGESSAAYYATEAPGPWFACPTSGSATNFKGIWGVDIDNAYAVGTGGVISKYDGIRWTGSVVTPGSNLNAIWGNSQNDIWAVGDGGTVVHYDGKIWNSATGVALDNYNIYGVWGDGNGGIWVVGTKGADGAVFKY